MIENLFTFGLIVAGMAWSQATSPPQYILCWLVFIYNFRIPQRGRWPSEPNAFSIRAVFTLVYLSAMVVVLHSVDGVGNWAYMLLCAVLIIPMGGDEFIQGVQREHKKMVRADNKKKFGNKSKKRKVKK